MNKFYDVAQNSPMIARVFHIHWNPSISGS